MKKSISGSYTIEAAVYIPMIMFMLFFTIEIAIDNWQESKNREVSKVLQEIDVVSEFYGYQIVDEIRKEIQDD